MPVHAVAAETLAAVRKSPGNSVRVAVADIDGILRGKYLHKDKFESAIESGFGFCDVVFGWDCHDVCYDNTTLTGWHKGFPDALARIATVLRRNASGFRARRPIGTFLLLGPTGVGKTETAKAIAECLFHSSDAMTRLDQRWQPTTSPYRGRG